MKIASSVVPFERIASDFHGYRVKSKPAPLNPKGAAPAPALLPFMVSAEWYTQLACSETRNLCATRLSEGAKDAGRKLTYKEGLAVVKAALGLL